jgi:hypothetical protein
MSAILVDPQHPEAALREALYSGNTVMLKPATASKKLCEFAWKMIQDAFSPLHPEQAQSELPVEKFSEIISQLKPRFTHSPEAKRFLRELFEELGWDPAKKLIYIPNGAPGNVTVVHQDSADKYTVVATVSTFPGAKTIAVDPKSHNVYLFQPERGPVPAPPPGTPPPAAGPGGRGRGPQGPIVAAWFIVIKP